MNRLNRYLAEKDYASKLALLEAIHNSSEYRNEIAAMRKRERLLQHTTRKDNGKQFKGYADTRVYKTHSRTGIVYDARTIYEEHTTGHMRGSESLVSAESFEICFLAGMDKAESVTRNIADNNL